MHINNISQKGVVRGPFGLGKHYGNGTVLLYPFILLFDVTINTDMLTYTGFRDLFSDTQPNIKAVSDCLGLVQFQDNFEVEDNWDHYFRTSMGPFTMLSFYRVCQLAAELMSTLYQPKFFQSQS